MSILKLFNSTATKQCLSESAMKILIVLLGHNTDLCDFQRSLLNLGAHPWVNFTTPALRFHFKASLWFDFTHLPPRIKISVFF